MKVLLLTDGIHPFVIGGMQKHSFNLAKWLVLSGVDVSLVHCVAAGEQAPSNQEVNQELFNGAFELEKIYAFTFPKKGRLPGHYIRNSYQYSCLIHDQLSPSLNDFDVIYIQGFAGWKLLERKHETTTPMYLNFHGLNMFQQSFGVRSVLESEMLRASVSKNIKLADVNVSLGGKLTEIIKEVNPKSPIAVSYNGIDENWIRALPEINENNSIVKFIFIGRYDKVKGFDILNTILEELKKEVNFEMHFIGPIPESHQVKLDNVFYHGSIKEESKIKTILDRCDVLVSPSYSEGMPTVINEAMARGLAIIATDVGAVSEQVKENGWLISAGNKSELKQAMLAALTDKLLKEKKLKSIKIVKSKFLWESVINDFLVDVKGLYSSKN